MHEAGRALVDVLAARGVRRFYTVPGESFLPVLEAASSDPRLQLVSTRHESGAAFMAEADAKLTGQPAVAMGTRGVGASNLAIGVHTAYQDATPMIVLLGQVETQHLHKEAFQEVDLTAYFAPITKWSVTAHRADRVCELVARAYQVAVSGRPGPVLVALPADLLSVHVPVPATVAEGMTGPQASDADVAELAEQLRGADRPVLIAGGGVRHARRELVAVAESYSCGVYTSFRRQDVFPNDHPHYLGILGLRPEKTTRALRDADLVVLAGSGLDEITSQGYTLPAPTARVVQIDVDPRPLGVDTASAWHLAADAGSVLAALARTAPAVPPERDWSAERQLFEDYHRVDTADTAQGSGLDPARVVAALHRHFPRDTVVTNDAGNFSGFVQRHWLFTEPHTQLGPVNGAMGYAVPAAVAAKLADPQRTVLAAVGDGGFLMTGAELETAVRLGLSFTVVVFRNGLYGTIAMHQAQTYGRLAGVDIGPVDVATVARGLGARAATVRTEDELERELSGVHAAGSPPVPMVLDVVTDPDLIAPGRRLATDLHPD
ncbi:MAG: thiamine pyrophosphate-binding protein [Streptosporangiales bacterium]|nr:thiamine pyrophosphate-binding protein [Streptosporangiales bacterium]